MGERGGILGRPGACQGQANAQDIAEGPPDVTLFSGHGSSAVLLGQPEYPICLREPVGPRITAQSSRVTPLEGPVPVIIIHPGSGDNHLPYPIPAAILIRHIFYLELCRAL